MLENIIIERNAAIPGLAAIHCSDAFQRYLLILLQILFAKYSL